MQKNNADLSTNWSEADIADYQRGLVNSQLAAMHAGQTPDHFAAAGTVMRWLKEHSQATKLSLLDAGCASAYYYEILEHYVPGLIHYTGLDFSPRMLKLARSYYPEIPLIQRDLRMLGPIRTNSYQVVMSGAALMHIREWRTVLEQLARIASDWLLLHRTWLLTEPGPTQMEVGEAYGHCVWYITFEFDEIVEILDRLNFDRIYSLDSGESAGEGKSVQTILFERRRPRG